MRPAWAPHRHSRAAFRGDFIAAMPRPAVTHLQENQAPARQDAPVIDAKFKIVGHSPRLSAALRFLAALCAAALIGALTPPLWAALGAVLQQTRP